MSMTKRRAPRPATAIGGSKRATLRRRSTGKLPDFLVIGAQKCGTTWLHQCLAEHPHISMPAGKDGGFFCYESTRTPEALDTYAAQYACTPAEGCLRGESTAAYFWTASGSEWDRKPEGFERAIPERVRETLGGRCRLLLCLRNPVERAVSAWFHHLRQGDLDPGTPLLAAGMHMGLIDMGFYGRHLRNWLQRYPRENFFILFMEDDIARFPRRTIREVYRFLEIDESFVPSGIDTRIYAGCARRRTSQGIHAAVNGLAEQLVIGRDTLERLADIYREDVGELEDLIGRDIREQWGF